MCTTWSTTGPGSSTCDHVHESETQGMEEWLFASDSQDDDNTSEEFVKVYHDCDGADTPSMNDEIEDMAEPDIIASPATEWEDFGNQTTDILDRQIIEKEMEQQEVEVTTKLGNMRISARGPHTSKAEHERDAANQRMTKTNVRYSEIHHLRKDAGGPTPHAQRSDGKVGGVEGESGGG